MLIIRLYQPMMDVQYISARGEGEGGLARGLMAVFQAVRSPPPPFGGSPFLTQASDGNCTFCPPPGILYAAPAGCPESRSFGRAGGRGHACSATHGKPFPPNLRSFFLNSGGRLVRHPPNNPPPPRVKGHPPPKRRSQWT